VDEKITILTEMLAIWGCFCINRYSPTFVLAIVPLHSTSNLIKVKVVFGG